VLALALAVALVAPALAADQMRRWRDADGQLHLSIEGAGGPAGAADRRAAEPSPQQRLSTRASLRRRELERALAKAGAELAAIRDELREVDDKKMVVTAPSAPSDPAAMQLVLDAQRDAFLRAHAFAEERQDQLRKLRRRERDKLKEIFADWESFGRLRDEVKQGYGGRLPAWWRDHLDCGECPSAAEAKAALHKPKKAAAAEAPSDTKAE